MGYNYDDVVEYLEEIAKDTKDTHEYFKINRFVDILKKKRVTFEDHVKGLFREDDIKEVLGEVVER